jgi:hypothetical protein
MVKSGVAAPASWMTNEPGVTAPLKLKRTDSDVAAGVPVAVEPSPAALNTTFVKPAFVVGTYIMPRVESTLTWPVAGTDVSKVAAAVFGVPEGLGTITTPTVESLMYTFP